LIGLPEILAGVILFALIAYALLGGADFGGGVWDLFASGPRAERQRETIAHAIGPIWEANHVWLILAIVLLFGAFPRAYAELSIRLHIPFSLLLIGIVLRGSAFVFRTYDVQEGPARQRWSHVFAVSSCIAPLLLGVVIGAISEPLAPTGPGTPFWRTFMSPWLGPLPIAVGLFALVQFAFLAAVYLTVEAEDAEVADDFRRRALRCAIALGVLALIVLGIAALEAPALASALLGRPWSWPLQIATGGFALAAIGLLWKRHYVVARLCAAAQVALILLGWGLAMYPHLLAGSLTIREAAAPEPVLAILLAALLVGSAILFPALGYLLRTFKGGVLLGPLSASNAGEGGESGEE
jgi:cytochrome d ubiquinol oxidase subunit II